MNAQIQPKTLIRLITVIVVACVVSTLLATPQSADAASDGYGVTALAIVADAPVMEGRSALILPDLN